MKRRIALASEVPGSRCAARVREEQTNSIPFRLKALPQDHPARKFACEVNPQFDREMK
jgi:hypothetical protein